VRLVDLERKYHISPQQLADHLGLSTAKAAALRRHLGVADADDRYCHVFDFGSQKPRRYSDNALRDMKQALEDGLDMDEVWRAARSPPCRAQVIWQRARRSSAAALGLAARRGDSGGIERFLLPSDASLDRSLRRGRRVWNATLWKASLEYSHEREASCSASRTVRSAATNDARR
jgi:hypothetical protein